jgi:hypothetical protein
MRRGKGIKSECKIDEQRGCSEAVHHEGLAD